MAAIISQDSYKSDSNLKEEIQLSNDLMESIWEDINTEAEAIVISDIKYRPESLSNIIYNIIDNKNKRHKILKNSEVRGLYFDIDEIRAHRDVIGEDITITILIEVLFRKDQIPSITLLDRVFLNSYCRRLLRAKLEIDYIDRELLPGLVITKYNNSEMDAALVEVLRLFRIICKYLGISSTSGFAKQNQGELIFSGCTSFHVDKLNMPSFWTSVYAKCVKLFGENRVPPIVMDQEINKVQTLAMLNIVMNTWSGSTLIVNDNIVNIIPATYVARLLPKLNFKI